MAIDANLVAEKIRKYRELLPCSLDDLETKTGIAKDRLQHFETGSLLPTGDEILILADFYRCDYRDFISHEPVLIREQLETLFRKQGDDLTTTDRWAIQEFIFLCESEDFLEVVLDKKNTKNSFSYVKTSKHHKHNAIDAAKRLREHLNYPFNKPLGNIYNIFRQMGIHIFRRRLENTGISGLFIQHPIVGPCILVNYTEDVYRQRFTLAHEIAHSILDIEEEFVVSEQSKKDDYIEIAANNFSSHFLIPRQLLKEIKINWNENAVLELSNKLEVSCYALSIALKDEGLISDAQQKSYQKLKKPASQKTDPELPDSFSSGSKLRQQYYLDKGISNYYINLGFDAYEAGHITLNKLAELLLTDLDGVIEIAHLSHRAIHYAD